MRRIMISILAVVFALLLAHRFNAADAPPTSAVPQTNALEFYAWSEDTEYVRVSKSLLRKLTIMPVAITNFDTMEFVLTDEFGQVFRLTPQEIERVNAAMSDALRQWRTEEGKHFVPVDEEPKVGQFAGRGLPEAAEEYHFRLEPFPQEAAAIRGKLEETVLTVLGEERARFFWQNGEMMLESEMKTFTKEQPAPPGMTRTTTYTFQLKTGNPPTEIDRFRTTVTTDARGGGGRGMGGRPYGEPLDRFAPEKMKPILARWRKATAEGRAKSGPPTKSLRESTVASAPTSAVPASAPRWDDAAAFVDLPKSLIKSLKVPGLTAEGEFSAEGVALFGLTPSEVERVHGLYDEMKMRFEQMERAHFERTAPGKNSFVLRAFPEKSKELQRHWLEKLKELVGKKRGELLDDSVRQPLTMFHLMNRGGPPFGERLHDRGQD